MRRRATPRHCAPASPSCPTGRARSRSAPATARCSRICARWDSRRSWASSPRSQRYATRRPRRGRSSGWGASTRAACPRRISRSSSRIRPSSTSHEPLALLASARALLKPGGLLMMVSHDYRHPLMRLLGARAPIIDIEHLQVFSRASLAFALERAGFARGAHRAVRESLPAALLGPALAAAAALEAPAPRVVAPQRAGRSGRHDAARERGQYDRLGTS